MVLYNPNIKDILNPQIDFDDLYDRYAEGEFGADPEANIYLKEKWSVRTGVPLVESGIVGAALESTLAA